MISSKRRAYGFIAVISAALLLCSCSSGAQSSSAAPAPSSSTPPASSVSQRPQPSSSAPTLPVPEPEPEFFDPLTGLPCEEEQTLVRPVAVMINNLQKALPQSGIGEAGIIYECMTEGSITRMLAVFNNYEGIEKIGPVRSARHYFIDLAYNNGAYYIHYGGSPQAYESIKKNGVKDVDGMTVPNGEGKAFYRDPVRVKQKGMYEHSAFTTGEGLKYGLEYKKYELMSDEPLEPAFCFAEKEYTPDGEEALKVTVPQGSYVTPVFEYDEKTGEYLRFQFGKEHIDELTGEQLSFKNVFVIYAPQNNIKGDTAGRIDVKLTGELSGLYITNGAAVPIKYVKQSLKDPAKYCAEDGSELKVNPGRSFVNVLSSSKTAKIEGKEDNKQ